MEKLFVDFYVVYVCTLATVSLAVNILLSAVICISPNKAGQYLKYTISFVAADFLYSTACVIAMPYWYQYPMLCALFPVSPLPLSTTVQARIMDLWWFVILGVLLLACVSFIHRHATVCNSILCPFFVSRWSFIAIVAIPFFSALYTKAAHSALSSDVTSLRSKLNSDLGEQLSVDFRSIALLAINFEGAWSSQLFCVGFALLFVTMAMLYLGIIYCAWKINRTIKKVTFSDNLKKKQIKALRILIFQTVNPLIFVYGPFVVIFIASLLRLDWHLPEKLAELLIHFFPINNAIIIITMTDEYRKTVLIRAHLTSSSDRSVVNSKLKRLDGPSVCTIMN